MKDPPVVIDPVKTTVDPKLIRTDADIRDAVKLWCSNRPEAENKYGHITDWDTSAVTNMHELFQDCKEFNDDISGWNVSNVKDMQSMFHGAAAFNQAIGQWNVSHVTTMYYMFCGAAAFNQDIGQWNVSQVTDMACMFYRATSMQNANKPQE